MTRATPRTTDTKTKPPMSQVSGLLDHRTSSVARAIFAKSVMKTRSSIAKAETTNLPVNTNAMATRLRLQDGAADLVDNPGQYALINGPAPAQSGSRCWLVPVRSAPRWRRPSTSVAVLTAIPTSACGGRAGASLTPSPVIPVTCPASCRCWTTMYLSSGKTSANPSTQASMSTASLPLLGQLRLSGRPRVECWQSNAARNFARNGQRVAGEHLHRNTEVTQ